jgi:hypothetical protein
LYFTSCAARVPVASNSRVRGNKLRLAFLACLHPPVPNDLVAPPMVKGKFGKLVPIASSPERLCPPSLASIGMTCVWLWRRLHGPALLQTGPCELSLRHLPIGRSARSSGRDLRFNDAMDQTLCPFHESQMVGEATLKQHTDTMVAGNIGGRHQGDVFRRAHMA